MSGSTVVNYLRKELRKKGVSLVHVKALDSAVINVKRHSLQSLVESSFVKAFVVA